MTDINPQAPQTVVRTPRSGTDNPGGDAGVHSGGDLIDYAELLFFAYRDFTADADAILIDLGFGRAHHRVLHFVARRPGLRVADLLEILKITKQSLARVLKQLVDEGYIVQRAGEHDRRERLLHPTAGGAELAGRLSALQSERIARALADAGPEARTIVDRFLFGMIKRDDRATVEALLARTKERGTALCEQEEGDHGATSERD